MMGTIAEQFERLKIEIKVLVDKSHMWLTGGSKKWQKQLNKTKMSTPVKEHPEGSQSWLEWTVCI